MLKCRSLSHQQVTTNHQPRIGTESFVLQSAPPKGLFMLMNIYKCFLTVHLCTFPLSFAEKLDEV